MSEKAWYRFCVNAEGSVPDYFEKELCRRFFAIQNNIELEKIENSPNYPGVENMPVDGLAYQSKWGGSWSDQMHSLEKIEENYSEYYPDLKKVIFYVEKRLPSESIERNKIDGIFVRLKKLGIEIEFFGKDAIHTLIHKDSQYRDLQKYFVTPIDEEKLLNLAEWYINELFIEDARMILDIVYSRLTQLNNEQKFTYYKLRGNLRCYDLEDSGNYEEEDLEAYKYEKGTSRAEILYSIAKIQQKDYEGLEKLLVKLSTDNSEPLAHRALLILYNAQGLTIEEIESKVQLTYKENTDTLKILGRIAFGKNNAKALDYFRKGYLNEVEEKRKFIDKMAYFQMYMAHVQEKFGLDDISIEGKQAYGELRKIYEEVKDTLPLRTLDKKEVAHIHNFLGVVNKRVFGDVDGGICLIKHALTIYCDPIIEFNLAKIYQDKKDISEAKVIYQKLLANFELNPSENPTIQQVVVLLSQIYSEEGNLEEAIKLLETFNTKHAKLLTPHVKKGIVIALSQAVNRNNDAKSAVKIINSALLEDTQNFPCLLIKHLITGNEKYLRDAYETAKDMVPSSLYPIYDFLQLAWRLDEHSFKEEAFNLYSKYLRNLEDKPHFERFLSICILKNDYSIANQVIEHYKDLFGEDSFYVYSMAAIYRREGKLQDAANLIKSFENYQTDLQLLFEFAHIGYELSDTSMIKFSLENIESNKRFKDLTNSFLMEFIKFDYSHRDKFSAIKKLYKYIQNEPLDTDLKELYFTLLMGDISVGDINPETVTEDTIITVKEIGTENVTKLSFDGYSSIGVDIVSKPGELPYRKIIGKSRGENIADIFKDTPLLSKNYEITRIENKYVRLYQTDVMGHMLHTGKMEAIPIIDDDMSNFIKILDKIDNAGNERNIQFDELHKSGMLLLSILSHFTNRSLYEIYNGITLGEKWNIISDTLTKFESRDHYPEKYVIDFPGIMTLSKLGILELISSHFKICISKSIFDYFTQEITKIECQYGQQSSIIIRHEDGKRSMIDNTKEMKEVQVAELRAIKEWIQNSCDILGNPTLNTHKDNDSRETLGEQSYDSLYLAKNMILPLISDDLALRKLGRNDEFGLVCLSTESLLGILYGKNIIDPSTYCNLIRRLMELNFMNLTFNTGVIAISLLQDEEKKVRDNLTTIYNYCKKNDVSLEFILISIFECIGNILSDYRVAKNKFRILMDVISQFYDFRIIKENLIAQLAKVEISEATKRFYRLITEYEDAR